MIVNLQYTVVHVFEIKYVYTYFRSCGPPGLDYYSHSLIIGTILFSPTHSQLNLGVGYEMTLQNEKALELYKGAQTDLESALSMHSDNEKPPSWIDSIRNAPCTSWDYPKLVWSQVS